MICLANILLLGLAMFPIWIISIKICTMAPCASLLEGGSSKWSDISYPSEGLLTYFLPMRADHARMGFQNTRLLCCHGSVVLANAAHNTICTINWANLYAAQYFDSTALLFNWEYKCYFTSKADSLSGSFHSFRQALLNRRFMKTHSVYPIQSRTVWQFACALKYSTCADFSL